MIVEVDLLGEVVLLVDSAFQVRDVFVARGPTRHESSYPIVFYTYRKLLTPVGQCAVCGYALEQLNEPCSASGGFHAFVGLAGESDVPELHKAEARALDLRRISYDEFDFYVEADNLFPVDQITQGFEV